MKNFKDLMIEQETEEDEFIGSTDLIHKMFDFITRNIRIDTLPEEEQDRFYSIVEMIGAEDEGDEEEQIEEVYKKKVRISPLEKQKRKREYRKKRAEIKRKAAQFRKKPAFKKYKKKQKKMAKIGKTALGKKMVRFK